MEGTLFHTKKQLTEANTDVTQILESVDKNF